MIRTLAWANQGGFSVSGSAHCKRRRLRGPGVLQSCRSFKASPSDGPSRQSSVGLRQKGQAGHGKEIAETDAETGNPTLQRADKMYGTSI